MDLTPELFGLNLIAARQRANLTQQQVADSAGITRPQVSNLEAGRGDPSFSSLLGLARALDTTVGTLLGESGIDLETARFITRITGHQRTMAAGLFEVTKGMQQVAEGYDALCLDVQKLQDEAYRAGREDAAREGKISSETCQENAEPTRLGVFVDAHLHECHRERGHRSLVHACACGMEWWDYADQHADQATSLGRSSEGVSGDDQEPQR